MSKVAPSPCSSSRNRRLSRRRRRFSKTTGSLPPVAGLPKPLNLSEPTRAISRASRHCFPPSRLPCSFSLAETIPSFRHPTVSCSHAICPIAATSSSKAGTSFGKTQRLPTPPASPTGSEVAIGHSTESQSPQFDLVDGSRIATLSYTKRPMPPDCHPPPAPVAPSADTRSDNLFLPPQRQALVSRRKCRVLQ